MADQNTAALIVADMPEVERLALISLCDGNPISDALVSKLYKRRLAGITQRGTKLDPKIERRPTPLGRDVADYIRTLPKQGRAD